MELPATMHKQNNQFQVSLAFEQLPENEDEMLVFGNAELLFTAIKNIVANACKYSSDNRASVNFSVNNKYFHIAVADKGNGIPANEFVNIFQPFYRMNVNRTATGFGLGLSLAYRIIKLHNGDISVHSETGKGSLFTITIPSAKRGGV
jgi:two-component system sensor histidine kinase ArlS